VRDDWTDRQFLAFAAGRAATSDGGRVDG